MYPPEQLFPDARRIALLVAATALLHSLAMVAYWGHVALRANTLQPLFVPLPCLVVCSLAITASFGLRRFEGGAVISALLCIGMLLLMDAPAALLSVVRPAMSWTLVFPATAAYTFYRLHRFRLALAALAENESAWVEARAERSGWLVALTAIITFVFVLMLLIFYAMLAYFHYIGY